MALYEYAGLAFVATLSGIMGGMSGLALGTMRLPFMLFTGMDPLLAAGTNLGVGLVGSAAASWEHLRAGRVVVRVVLIMGLPAVAGAFLGALFADAVSMWILLVGVSALILWSAFTLIVRSIGAEEQRYPPEDSPAQYPQRRTFYLARDGVVSFAIGMLGGAVGLVLAMLRMPALINLLKLAPAQAVGTNTGIGVLIGLFGMGGHLLKGNVAWPLLGIMGGSAAVGFFFGARLTGAVPPERLRLMIGIILLALAPLTLANGISRILAD